MQKSLKRKTKHGKKYPFQGDSMGACLIEEGMTYSLD